MRYLFILFIIFTAPSYAIELPEMGASTNTVISLAEEQSLGKGFMRSFRRQADIIDDIELDVYINTLGKQLVSHSDTPQQAFHFFIIHDDAINAFAVPGGYIGVYSGLILKTTSESELASVIAHEIAHVTQRHIARFYEKMDKYSLPMLAATLAGLAAATLANNADMALAALAVGTGLNQQLQIDFTREHEKEADRVGMHILHGAGFEPYDMANFFEKLQEQARYYTKVPEFLRTHPVSTNRMAEAKERASQYEKILMKDTPLYHLMRAKLLVLLEEDSKNLLKTLNQMLEEGRYRDERATHYAIALTKLKMRETAGVQTQLDWLNQNDEDRLIYRITAAKLALAEKQPTKALDIYEQASKIYPDDLLLNLTYAEDLLHYGDAKKAKQLLLATPFNENPKYYALLTQVYRKLGEIGEAYLAGAERFYLNGDTRAALAQLQQARKLKNLDFYLASRIEARYKEINRIFLEEEEMKRKK